MISLLLGMPTWVKAAIAGAALLGLLQVRHWWEVRGLEKQIATLTDERDAERTANAALRVSLSEVQANRDTLESRLREQGRAIELLQVTAKAAESKAALASARAIAAGRKASEALRAPTTSVPPGHGAMNEWLRIRFARE